MSYNYQKSDNTLKAQLIRIQLETIAFCRIKRGLSDRYIVDKCETFWLSECKALGIEPENSFKDEFKTFEEESLLKFAPEATYVNMEEKAKITLKKMSIDISDLI